MATTAPSPGLMEVSPTRSVLVPGPVGIRALTEAMAASWAFLSMVVTIL